MVRFKVLASLIVITICAAAVICWDSAVQPEIVSRQAFRQMEVHTDGTGDRAASERRMLTNGLAVPAEIILGACALAALLAIWCDEIRALVDRPSCPQKEGVQQ
jgi:hypothetical protein